MFPVILDLESKRMLVLGEGAARDRRVELVRRAMRESDPALQIYDPAQPPEAHAMAGAVILIAGLPEKTARIWAKKARDAGALVNVEDMPELCDFHVPAQLRRGDLLVTVSTGGKAPALARALREALEVHFGDEWAGRLGALAEARAEWRAQGASAREVSRRARSMIEEQAWLQ